MKRIPVRRYIRENNGMTISTGTLRNQDLFPEFLRLAYYLDITITKYKKQVPARAKWWRTSNKGKWENDPWWDTDDCASLLWDDLMEELNTAVPNGFYFGNTDGDGACFGVFRLNPKWDA